MALDVDAVEHVLFSIHGMLAAMLSAPEMALDKDESKMLASAISNVSRHYDVEATQKQMDWANLATVCGMVYGTRIFAMRNRARQEATTRQPEQPTTGPASQANKDNRMMEIPGVGLVPMPQQVQ